MKREDGMVTAELAVTLPAVTTLLVFILAVASFGSAQVQTCSLARAGARAAALGQAPPASVQIKVDGQQVVALATKTPQGMQYLGVEAKCEAVAVREPDGADP
ncbi:MAG: hypothetical protein Q4A71_05295 [Actinomycetaceae bacterium]|nr:hypothetical protein [Actinomycetaceae bacterium]